MEASDGCPGEATRISSCGGLKNVTHGLVGAGWLGRQTMMLKTAHCGSSSLPVWMRAVLRRSSKSRSVTSGMAGGVLAAGQGTGLSAGCCQALENFAGFGAVERSGAGRELGRGFGGEKVGTSDEHREQLTERGKARKRHSAQSVLGRAISHPATTPLHSAGGLAAQPTMQLLRQYAEASIRLLTCQASKHR